MNPICPSCRCCAKVRDNRDGTGFCQRCYDTFPLSRAGRAGGCACPACKNPGHKLEQARANFANALQTGEVVDVPVPVEDTSVPAV